MRIGSISSNRQVEIKFTNSMDFPDIETFVDSNSVMENGLLDIMMLSAENEKFSDNLSSWKFISVESTLITLDLEF